MRNELCQAMLARASNPRMIFITGDLGYMALEPLQIKMKKNFINAGVSEQNMLSVSAALASQGFEVWVYSISPFLYARGFEQIRNDICFHDLPVKIIGNGGGYGYGVMGPTHHAIEDCGVLLTLPNMRAYAPVFKNDIKAIVDKVGASSHPCYIRIGIDQSPAGYNVPQYQPIRKLMSGAGPVIIVLGSIASMLVERLEELTELIRPNLWVVSELPIDSTEFEKTVLLEIEKTSSVLVVEEHVARGGLGAEVMLSIVRRGIKINYFRHFSALKHNFDRLGSQNYLREKSCLDTNSILRALIDFQNAK